ncbi:gluconate kinase (SKI family) [Antricoccus suffuscus]|uniref:Gluconokinase n=1 Tax=Antricoccus suffuscus TaxID=1629062 RepID=A0A2T0ZJU6_9ACTN|nr:gluconokinase [Antricoccus suffuscus]PRZ36577.1 gluconate kinase (SKI family) [Antricoccus suffuscus]
MVEKALGDSYPPIVTMGVSGSGKTTAGRALAERLGVPYADADDFHSESNIAKMASGTPLTDADRWPWLEAVGAWLGRHQSGGGVMGCSALRVAYRDVLRKHAPGVLFVHLEGERSVVVRRVAERSGHFMPAALVDSQYATLEELEPRERGLVVDFDLPIEQIVDKAVAYVAAN